MVYLFWHTSLAHLFGTPLWQASLASVSDRRDAEARIASPQPSHERNRQQHHPRLADDLAEQEFQRAEGEPQKHDGIDDQSHHPRRDDGNEEPAPSERGIDREIGEFREQERGRRSD